MPFFQSPNQPNKTSRRELTKEQQKIITLEKENKELKIANEILKRRMCTSPTIQVDEVPLYEKPLAHYSITQVC